MIAIEFRKLPRGSCWQDAEAPSDCRHVWPGMQPSRRGRYRASPLSRGRNTGCPVPPPVPDLRSNASGCYLEYLTANRRSGHGCRMRTGGHNSSVIRSSLFQAKRCRWERRRTTAIQMRCTWRTNARSHWLLPGRLALRIEAGGIEVDPPPAAGSNSESRQLLDPSRAFVQAGRCPKQSFRPIGPRAEVVDNFIYRNDIPDIDLDV